MQKLGCDGNCPAFKLALFANGSALLLPKSNMAFTEDQVTVIPEEQRYLLLRTLATLDTSDLQLHYPSGGRSDLPPLKVAFYQQGKWAEIEVQSGEPPHLTELLMRLEALVSVSRWKPVASSQ